MLFFSLASYAYPLIGAGIVVLFAVIVIAIVYFKNKKSKGTTVDKVKVIKGVRYTESGVVEKGNGDVQITHNTGDIVLKRNVEYVVKKGGEIIPGKYTVLSAKEGGESFNMRVDGYVREFAHNSSLVLAEGDKVCAVSDTVILR